MKRISSPKKQLLMDKLLYVALGLIVVFAWMDSLQMSYIRGLGEKLLAIGVYPSSIGLWENFHVQGDAIITTWYLVMAAIALIWYFYSKDWSETTALFLVPATLIFFGTQDLLFFIFSGLDIFTNVGAWANNLPTIHLLTIIFGLETPNGWVFILSGVLGLFAAYYLYGYLKKQSRW